MYDEIIVNDYEIIPTRRKLLRGYIRRYEVEFEDFRPSRAQQFFNIDFMNQIFNLHAHPDYYNFIRTAIYRFNNYMLVGICEGSTRTHNPILETVLHIYDPLLGLKLCIKLLGEGESFFNSVTIKTVTEVIKIEVYNDE